MIWTLTLNAVIDHVYHASFPAGDNAIADAGVHLPSGKGLNVSRALTHLGLRSTAVILCGKDAVPAYRAELRRLGVIARLIPGLSHTRQHVTLLGDPGRPARHVRERGAPAPPGTLERLQRALADVRAGDAVALCGTAAPGLPEDAQARLLDAVAAQGAKCWVDTSGEPLRRCLARRPYAVKVNAEELAAVIGHPLADVDTAAAAVRHLLAEGVELVCVTMGASGLVLGRGREIVFVPAPLVGVISPVGSGDTALAALLAADPVGNSLTTLAVAAVAAGAANTLNAVPGRIDRQQFEDLEARIAPTARRL